MKRLFAPRLLAGAVAVLFALSPGCNYSIGHKPAHDLDEIAVPIFENATLRRGLEHRLTAEVRRVILETTPLHLGHESSSRAILRGVVSRANEQILIQGTSDSIVESSLSLTIQVSVVERSSGRLLIGSDTDGDGAPDAPITLTDSQNFVPSLGGSRDTASGRLLRDLAERTAQLLEKDWGGAQGD